MKLFNWLCKHVEKVRSGRDFALTSSCTELSFCPWVSLRQDPEDPEVFCKKRFS